MAGAHRVKGRDLGNGCIHGKESSDQGRTTEEHSLL